MKNLLHLIEKHNLIALKYGLMYGNGKILYGTYGKILKYSKNSQLLKFHFKQCLKHTDLFFASS